MTWISKHIKNAQYINTSSSVQMQVFVLVIASNLIRTAHTIRAVGKQEIHFKNSSFRCNKAGQWLV